VRIAEEGTKGGNTAQLIVSAKNHDQAERSIWKYVLESEREVGKNVPGCRKVQRNDPANRLDNDKSEPHAEGEYRAQEKKDPNWNKRSKTEGKTEKTVSKTNVGDVPYCEHVKPYV